MALHKNLTDPELHESKGASTATAGQVPIANGSGGTTWGTPSTIPTAHASTHGAAGSDPVTVTEAQVTNLTTDLAGKCSTTDPRLSDARTPTAHATTHKSGGTDAIKLDELAAPADNTNLNVSTSAHGLTPKAPNDTTKFLRGDGTWALPTGTDSDAIHKSVAGEIAGLTAKASPVAADILIIEDSAAANAKKKITVGSALGLDLYGQNVADAVSEGTSTNSGTTPLDKVTLTTPALTGTFRVGFYCELSNSTSNKNSACRLYNSTDAVELCNTEVLQGVSNIWIGVHGFCDVAFTGAAKTFNLQFWAITSGTVSIRRARIEFWREF